jgi:hypothetical protein
MKEHDESQAARLWIPLAIAASIFISILWINWPSHGSGEDQAGEIWADVTAGKTTGSLTGHYVPACVSASDAYNYKYGGTNIDDPKANEQIKDKLLGEHRCFIGPDNIKYDMTVDGKVQFTTPHGSIELWPVSTSN